MLINPLNMCLNRIYPSRECLYGLRAALKIDETTILIMDVYKVFLLGHPQEVRAILYASGYINECYKKR